MQQFKSYLKYNNESSEYLLDILFSMIKYYLDIKILSNMFRKMLSAIYRSVLSSGTSESKHQIGKLSLNISLHMCICKRINILHKFHYTSIILKEFYHLRISTYKMFVMFKLPRVLNCTAIEYISATVPGCILRNTLFVSKTEDTDLKSFFTSQVRELSHGGQLHKQLLKIRILGKRLFVYQFSQIVYCKRNTL